jgi:hypothetical protein
MPANILCADGEVERFLLDDDDLPVRHMISVTLVENEVSSEMATIRMVTELNFSMS